ncbi:hypothetical protein L202_01978 [Cryptococcus amylolentus CBS 6039]|uniref:Uncharacterized protein n=2 Tax=Cryptococcus amylolentus TaxID=104669 RepID=A0A1E3HYX7_9TREE|nr:hypothetical protein L202_01978 [Cryptococcus amylolentus CBS 6039]ODN81563.1 hypothetical protein L202_01978 [Cryptococcus amylolentus CBS 6039]ODO10212.1 hypothetical protein I350_02441 [Cryptococcus amylolentus CBS 6273]
MAATAYLWVENVPTSDLDFKINGGNIIGDTDVMWIWGQKTGQGFNAAMSGSLWNPDTASMVGRTPGLGYHTLDPSSDSVQFVDVMGLTTEISTRFPRSFPSVKYTISVTPLDERTLGCYLRAYKAHNLALAGKLEDLKPGFETFWFKGAEKRISGVSLTNPQDEHPVIATLLGQKDGSRFRRRPWPKAFVRTPSGGALPVSFHSLGALPDTAILTCGFSLEGYVMSGDSKAGIEWVTEIFIIEGLLEEMVSVGAGPNAPLKRKAEVGMDVLLGLTSGKKAAAVAVDSAPNTPTKSSAVSAATAPVAGPSTQPLSVNDFLDMEAGEASETEGEARPRLAHAAGVFSCEASRFSDLLLGEV